MPTYVPTTLPDAFQWIECEEERVLHYKGIEVVRVAPQKQGWFVEVLVPDLGKPRPRLLTRSRQVGMCWGSKWAKERVIHFEQLAFPTNSTSELAAG
ncbi:hypothetical protein GCM10007235_32490 [Pseudoxanthomonas indica]|nr:hypothetical protein GCM10007235_32490 [Pseudoxanthomonas indica]